MLKLFLLRKKKLMFKFQFFFYPAKLGFLLVFINPCIKNNPHTDDVNKPRVHVIFHHDLVHIYSQ